MLTQATLEDSKPELCFEISLWKCQEQMGGGGGGLLLGVWLGVWSARCVTGAAKFFN